MKDKWKVIHTFKKWNLAWDFLEIEFHTEVKNNPKENNNQFVSCTIITKWIWKSIEDSESSLHILNNFDCNYTVNDLKEYLDEKIKSAEYEVERWNSIKIWVLDKAEKLWFWNQKFNHLQKWTKYKDYYNDWIEEEDLSFN